jgi:hypothetical protein
MDSGSNRPIITSPMRSPPLCYLSALCACVTCSNKSQVELTPFLKPFEQLLAKKAQQDSQAALEQLKKLLEQKKGNGGE